MRLILLVVALSAAVFAAEPKEKAELPPIPTDLTLASGSTLRKISIVRWEKDRVVIKHAGGTDPVRFAHMSPAHRAIFEKRLELELAVQRVVKEKGQRDAVEQAQAYSAKIASKDAAEARRREFDLIASKGNVVTGMPAELVVKAWGQPAKKNTGGGLDQWVYYGSLRFSNTAYVYLDNGIVRSVDMQEARR